MSPTKKQLQQLELIHRCPKKLKKELISRLPKECIKTICECTLNLLKGNVPLTKQQKKNLQKYKSTLRDIADKKKSLFVKRKLIIQKGGFLPILIPTVISVLTKIIDGIR